MRLGPSAGVVLALASLVLAGCGGASSTTSSIAGQPSIDISVPLALSGCDGHDTCYSLGTTGFGEAAGQVTTNGRAWNATSVPGAADTVMTTMSCWTNGCLFGGTDGNDVLWAAQGASISAVGAPSGGRGVLAVSCYAPSSCAAIDAYGGPSGADRFTETTDGGLTWSTPRTMPASSSDPALALRCLSALACVVSVTHSEDSFPISTTDGGLTWSTSQDATGFTKLDDLFCAATSCVGIAHANGPAQIYTSTSASSAGVGLLWQLATHQPVGTINALACVRTTTCVAVGENANGGAWLATSSKGRWTTQPLQYVTDPITSVGCGTHRCVASNGTSTVVVTP